MQKIFNLQNTLLQQIARYKVNTENKKKKIIVFLYSSSKYKL